MGPFAGKAIQIAVGQIRGFVEPTAAEREAAFELFVELASRTTTVALTADQGLIREALTSLHQVFALTREILRRHGVDVAKSRHDGNLSLATIALRVLNEIIRPRTSKWHPLLQSWEGRRPAAEDPVTWERGWEQARDCRADLNALSGEIRAYMDSLAKIAGAPSLTDLVVPPPPSAPIQAGELTTPCSPPAGAVARAEMVRWFDPIEGVRTLIAKRRGDPSRTAAGRRACANDELQVIDIAPHEDGDTWIDYVSDLGDGFDPTAAVAWQLTRPTLALPADRNGELPSAPAELRRGQLLVMGGDEVYPYATPDGYRNQLELPYTLTAGAEPADWPSSHLSPAIVAIPGNHDWYGGIDLFHDVFVTAPSFAGHWQAPQTERWWVVRLSHGWWIWGVDTALDNTLDDDQAAYFEQAAQLLGEGDRVILCSPVPLWQLRQKRKHEYFDLRQFFDRLLLDRKATMPLFLAGDSHFFAHYERVDGVADEHHITAGGGGAFLQPTHNLPEQVPLERGAPDFKLTHRWPRPVDSRSLATGLGGLRDRQTLWLVPIAGLLHAAYAGLLSISAEGSGDGATPAELVKWAAGKAPGWPLLLLVIVAMIVATAPNSTESELTTGAKRYGAIHGGLQATALVLVASLGRWLSEPLWRFGLVPLVGSLVTIALFVLVTRWINDHIKASDTIAYSSSHLTRYKHFLRMRVDDTGQLSLYVIGLDPVGEDWFGALTESGRLVPPFDPAGAPRIHYVWGDTIPGVTPVE